MENWLLALIVIVGYWTLSTLFLHFPNLLFWILPPKKNALVVTHGSHRGGSAEYPENTISAFRHAVELGSNLLELDVHLTADKKVVVFHDFELSRVCGGPYAVRELEYASLPPIRSQLMLPFPFNYPAKPLNFECEEKTEQSEESHRIPLLEEVFQKFPSPVCINIDLKEPSDELLDEVDKLVVQYGRENSVIWGTFHQSFAERITKKNPKVATFFPMKEVLKIFIKYYLGILPFLPMNYSVFEIGFLTSEFEAFIRATGPSRFGRFGRSCCVNLIIRLYKHFSSRKSLIQHLQKRGIKVIYWVLNEDEDFMRAFSLGVDGVMTDYPTRLRDFLMKHNPGWKSLRSA